MVIVSHMDICQNKFKYHLRDKTRMAIYSQKQMSVPKEKLSAGTAVAPVCFGLKHLS